PLTRVHPNVVHVARLHYSSPHTHSSFLRPCDPRYLSSFPTRRSSDLCRAFDTRALRPQALHGRCAGRLIPTPFPRRWRRDQPAGDRKSTRLNSSHGSISYAVVSLKKKNNHIHNPHTRIANRSRKLS